ncbi:hypothetical protein N9S58_01285 [Candidatus Pelagibacter sp.]|nr:hypothetical protein [Candidatus Pelagibacter sp.]
MIKKYKKSLLGIIKGFKLIFFLTIFTLYSLEILVTVFLNKEVNFTNTSYEELKAKKIESIKNFDKRSDQQAFLEESIKNNLVASFRYSRWHLDQSDYKGEINKLINNQIKNHKIIPFRGPINKKSLSSNESGVRKIIYNDKYGFKNFNSVYQKNIDIMLIGDSFAEGVPFDNFNDINARINKLPNINSLNYGISGTGPIMALAIVKEYAKHLKPKNVFYLFYEGNDLDDLMIEKKDPHLSKYLKEFHQNLYNSNNEIESFLHKYENLIPEIIQIKMSMKEEIKIPTNKKNNDQIKEIVKNFLELDSLKNIFFYSSVYSKYKTDYRLFNDVILNMKKEVENWGGNYHFVYLPSWLRYNNKISIAGSLHKHKILNIVEELGIPHIDIDQTFIEKELNNLESFNLGLYGHYTKRGYLAVADEIIKSFSDNQY